MAIFISLQPMQIRSQVMQQLLPIMLQHCSKDGCSECFKAEFSPDYLEYYLDEFTFRFNRRTSKSRGKLFYRLIEQALQIEPVPAKIIKYYI